MNTRDDVENNIYQEAGELRAVIRDQLAALTAIEIALREHHEDFGHPIGTCQTCSFIELQVDVLRKRANRYQI